MGGNRKYKMTKEEAYQTLLEFATAFVDYELQTPEDYVTDDELINNFKKVIDGREVVRAIGNATNGEYIAKNSFVTLMGGFDEYDEKGRKVSVDPNYFSGSLNICGKTYPLVRVGWEVYIWKPEYPDATYTWVWREDRDRYLFAKISLMPDYVRRYKERKENEELEYKKRNCG